MNEYSFEIKKKYGGEHPSYSGIFTCNGSEYSMMLSADEEKEFSATIRDTAEMQKAYSQQDSLYVHIYPGEDELEALALNALGALRGQLPVKEYR